MFEEEREVCRCSNHGKWEGIEKYTGYRVKMHREERKTWNREGSRGGGKERKNARGNKRDERGVRQIDKKNKAKCYR